LHKRRQLVIGTHVSARPLRYQSDRKLVYRPLQFNKRGQYFIAAHDETPSITVRVNYPDYSALGIDG
jgi:hypothetical protein